MEQQFPISQARSKLLSTFVSKKNRFKESVYHGIFTDRFEAKKDDKKEKRGDVTKSTKKCDESHFLIR